jgi:ethanolamine utilization microcompartment shell protein EutS
LKLDQFIRTDEEHTISSEAAAILNEDLATKHASEIPIAHRQKLLDYLIAALNMNSVEHAIRSELERLAWELQESSNQS